MKRIIALICLLCMAFTLCLTSCTPTSTDPVNSDGTDTKSDASEETKSDGEQEEEEYKVVTSDNKLAWNKAVETAEYEQSEIRSFSAMRLPRFLLPCNKQFKDRMQYAIDVMKNLLADYPRTVYVYTVYTSHDYMEGTWQEIMVMNQAAIGAGWVKKLGWYMQNVSTKQGEDSFYYAYGSADTSAIPFEILDETIADRKTAGSYVDDAAVEAFKQVCIKLVQLETNAPGFEMYSAWMSTTTDLDSRLIEQIYYDMFQEGISEDCTENNNEMCIEQISKGNFRKPYKDVNNEDMKASIELISNRYNEMAELYPALKPYADNYAAYVAQWSGK